MIYRGKITIGLLLFPMLVVLISACVEPYEFVIKNERPVLVVEGYISNVSYYQSAEYPSDPRFFKVRLSYTSNVDNVRNQPVRNATVFVEDDHENQWYYTYEEESAILHDAETYVLWDPNFKVVEGRSYRLSIRLATDEVFYSEWTELPKEGKQEMGDLFFKETNKQEYVSKGTEMEVEEVSGVNLFINLPENGSDQSAYYRWTFEPVWIYEAPLARSSEPAYRCWVRNQNYLSNYVLQHDHQRGYDKALFFIKTKGNERVYTDFSLLVRQQSLNEGAFYFWKEMQELAGPGGVFDKPPYNLRTNLYAASGDASVFGYFVVAREQAKRWRFSIYDLSYPVENDLKKNCLLPYGPPISPDPCRDCRAYTNGKATVYEPNWWAD